MKHKNTPLLGVHMSISDGLENAILQAETIGCTAIQIFTKSNRQWHAKQITNEQAQLFKTTLANSSIQMVVAHAAYLINLGSPKADITKKSIKALIEELHRCDQLSIPYLVLHPGSHLGSDTNSCIQRITENIDIVLQEAQSTTMILLETMAGQGSSVCSQFEEIATIINSSKHSKKIGVCFDTCHAFVAGYDFRDETSYKQMWHTFNTIIGLNHLKLIHLNDSKKDLGMHTDRHEDIGKGKLGLKAFRLIINDPQLARIPKIMETPKETLDDDKRNMATVLQLIDN